MAVYFLPEFIVDLQGRKDAHFARRVLQRTVLRTGAFREDGDDHRYHGVENAWIRYVSGGNSAYRVIFLRIGSDVYLYRAGGHDIEERLTGPRSRAYGEAVSVTQEAPEVAAELGPLLGEPSSIVSDPPPNRFLRNNPTPDINRTIFSRRNLPHRDIWLVAPFITPKLMLPTTRFGRMMFDQMDDGASILVVTAPPKDQDISWLEDLAERDVGIYFYPKLHSKLYCFILDEDRRYERGLPDPEKLSSLVLVGSANMTEAGLALSQGKWNEELCYSVPASEVDHAETYVNELINRGYDLKEVRAFRARGQWQRLEKEKW